MDRRTLSLVLVTVALVAIAALPMVRARSGRAPGSQAGVLETAIAEVEAGRRTTPLVGEPGANGEHRVTFLAKSHGGEVPRVVSDVTGWGENVADDTFDFNAGRMARVGNTNWYSLATLVAPRARIEYLIVHGNDYALDPWNPRQTRIRGGGPASEFVTPGYVPAADPSQLPPAPAGGVSESRIASRALGGTRRVIVYTPPGYHPGGAYPVAVFEQGVRPVGRHDARGGGEGKPAQPSIEAAISPRLLDHLIGTGAMEPLIVAFVESAHWGDSKEHSSGAMRTFLSGEVPAWMAAHYAVSAKADNHAVLGISAGAREAVAAAIGSSAFGKVGLLIPGRRVAREPDLVGEIAKVSRPLHVAILAGRYDHANLSTAVGLRRAFVDAGGKVDYIEVAEGHNQASWHDHVAKVLIALFKPQPSAPASSRAASPSPLDRTLLTKHAATPRGAR